MSGYGFHWTPCRGAGGSGPVVVIAVLALLAIGSGAVSAVVSALEVAFIVTASVVALAVPVAAFVLVRRVRARESPAFIVRDVPREAVTAAPRPQVTAIPVPAIAPPQVTNYFNFYGADAGRAAALIRQALPGTAGAEIITEE